MGYLNAFPFQLMPTGSGAWLRAVFPTLPTEETPLPATTATCRRMALVALTVTALIGVCGIAAWLLQPDWLLAHALFLMKMRFNTALLMLLGACGVFVLLRGKPEWGAAAGMVMLFWAMTSVAEFLTGMNVGIDEIFLKDNLFAHLPYPGRLAPNTAVMFGCIGLALLLEGLPKGGNLRHVVVEFGALAAVVMGLLSMAGYIIHQPLAYSWGGRTAMALPTTVASICLGTAMVFAAWSRDATRAARVTYWMPVMMSLLVMIFDLAMPLGVAAGMAYVPLVFCGLWFARGYTPFVFAGLGSVLTVAGYWLSPPGPFGEWIVVTNRVMTVAVLWFVAVLVYLSHRAILQQKRSQARLKALVDTTINSIIIIDSRGTILSFNPASEKMFGYTADEAIGRNVNMLMPESYRKRHDTHLSAKQERILGMERELEGRRKDGSIFPMQLSVTSIDVDGQRTYSGIIRDITEQKRMEDLLKKSADAMGAHNLELERSNQELEHFAYMASHDLQEPLRMVRSYCALLKDKYAGKLDKEGEEFLNFAVDGAERMQLLIRDLLVYSRASRNEFSLREVDFSQVLQEVCSNLKGTLDATGAKIVVEQALPTLTAERTMLGQVIQNLMANAMKFHKPGVAPEIRIHADVHEDAWVFSIKDNGIGFEPQFGDRIFEMFKRLHNREEFEGTGIGLAVCKRIVERHGGKIWGEGRPGDGATFFFTIPNTTPTFTNQREIQP